MRKKRTIIVFEMSTSFGFSDYKLKVSFIGNAYHSQTLSTSVIESVYLFEVNTT